MKKSYAISPISTDFILSEKEYPIKELRDNGFTIAKEDLEFEASSDLHCLIHNCWHLNPKQNPPINNWKLIKK